MSDDFEYLQEALDAYRETPESFALELRMSLSELLIENLHRLGWTQAQLAEKVERADAFISRVLHGDENCTLKTAGLLLWALGVRGRVTRAFDTIGDIKLVEASTDVEAELAEEDHAEDRGTRGGSAYSGEPQRIAYRGASGFASAMG